MIKVLIINSVPTEKNGITNVIFNFLSKMDTTGIQLDLLSINDPENMYRDIVEQKGGHLFILERSGRKIFQYLRALRSLIKTGKYDIVHVHGNSHTLVLELMAAKLAGCRVRIAHAHNTTCNNVLLHKILTPCFNVLCTNGLACGADAGKWMFGEKPFKVLNNGVNIMTYAFNKQLRDEYRKQFGFGKTVVIGHVGTFIPVKNQAFIVDIFNELVTRNESLRLMLIGEGPLMEDVKEKVDGYGLTDKVVFTGGVHNVNELLNAIDIIVMPSLYEGLPLSLIEQQANGLQCVVADTITKEADKTGNVKYLSLNDGVEVWAEEISHIDCLNGRKLRSEKACEDIAKAGYNIKEQARILADFYNDAVQKKK